MDSPLTWKSEGVFEMPRYLIRAGDGKFWLYHCQSGVAPFQILSAVESLSAAKALANSHHHEGIEAERMLQRAVS